MKTKITLLFLTLILCACSTASTTPQTFPAQAATETPFPQSKPKIIVTVGTPHIDPGPDGEFQNPVTDIPSTTECGYQWAYEDLPELSAQFDSAIKDLIPNSVSRATAFGENCIGSDGQVVRFLAMETDFYVIVSVKTMDDYETFGTWIAQVMRVVNVLPPGMLVGPKPGFVEFRLEKSTTEGLGFRVPIQGYNETTEGVTGEELFRLFYTE